MTRLAAQLPHGGIHYQHLEKASHHHLVAARELTRAHHDHVHRAAPIRAQGPAVTTYYKTLHSVETRLIRSTHHVWQHVAAAYKRCRRLLIL